MCNSIDDKIRMIAADSQFPLSQNYDYKVTLLLNRLEANEHSDFFILFRRTVGIAAALALSFSCGAYAAANYAIQRFESMSNDEKLSYMNDVRTSAADSDNYSRKLTAAEAQSLELLQTEYQSNGRFPEGKVLQVDSKHEVVKDCLCFVSATSTFYLPEREMTEDELLALIDFYCKRDFSITDTYAAMVAESNIRTPSAKKEAAVKKTAAQLLLNVYGIDLNQTDYSMKLLHHNAEIMDDTYWIQVSNGEKRYTVGIDAESGLFQSIQYTNTAESTSSVIVDEALYIDSYKQLKELLTSEIAPDAVIQKAYLEYKYDNRFISPNGIATYYFELENNTGYTLQYNCNEKVIQEITYEENISNFKLYLHNNSEFCQIHNIIQQVVELH